MFPKSGLLPSWSSFLPLIFYNFEYISKKEHTSAQFSGQTCPYPGSLPHGNWTCEMQEIPILGTSFLDEEAQSYPGELGYQKRITKS